MGVLEVHCVLRALGDVCIVLQQGFAKGSGPLTPITVGGHQQVGPGVYSHWGSFPMPVLIPPPGHPQSGYGRNPHACLKRAAMCSLCFCWF